MNPVAIRLKSTPTTLRHVKRKCLYAYYYFFSLESVKGVKVELYVWAIQFFYDIVELDHPSGQYIKG